MAAMADNAIVAAAIVAALAEEDFVAGAGATAGTTGTVVWQPGAHTELSLTI